MTGATFVISTRNDLRASRLRHASQRQERPLEDFVGLSGTIERCCTGSRSPLTSDAAGARHAVRPTRSDADSDVVWAFPIGVVFGLVALRTRSLAPVMVLHMANNAVATFV